MREERSIMGMPITVEVVGVETSSDVENVFIHFQKVDEQFSTYKNESEISKINRGEIAQELWSGEMKEVFTLAEKTNIETDGYFDIRRPDGLYDPSGIVKGWAIEHAANLLKNAGHENFFIDAGGDIALMGKNEKNEEWSVGIKNPFKQNEIVKVLYPKGRGVATSGNYIRGAHIYNPHNPNESITEIVSLTVIGVNVLEADRFATAAFAMGRKGIEFIERTQNLEGYLIDSAGRAIMTSGFEKLTVL